ncbi:MAG TPA: polyprenyl synthetase family protein [Aeromicrobium sp.]|nr:polyprenyl synthetase family protein [Aeromicrobium sp.]
MTVPRRRESPASGMSLPPPDTDDAFHARVDAALARFSAAKRAELEAISPELAPFADAAIEFIAGGKRLRPLFCRAGWLVAGGDPDLPAFVDAAASLEWLQGSALAHDDLMDGSDTRRGRPSLHRQFEQLHRADNLLGSAERHGAAAAILLGDLMLSWVDEQFRASDLPHLADALPWLDRCKTEVAAGQYLDVLAQARGNLDVDVAMRVIRYKSAKYTVERPMHIGAALAGADAGILEALSAVALPLGEAFQLRDDVLGVFGDPAVTGKPAGDDLREGKRTVLIARTAAAGTAADRERIEALLGTADGVDELSAMIESSGALAAVEADIARLEGEALAALDRLPHAAREVLETLIRSATRRER